MDLFRIVRQSKDTARCDDVPLRTTKTTRLVFRTDIVNNAQDSSAPVRGWLVFQKKRKTDEWEDHNEVKLSDLRADEWVKTELKAGEVDKLIRHIAGLYRLYQRDGLPAGRAHYLRVDLQDGESASSAEATIDRLLEISRKASVDVFGRVVDWTLDNSDSGAIIQQLDRLDVSTVRKLHSLSGVATLRSALDEWESNQSNSSEGFWQKTIQQNAFVLSQTFSFPVLIVQGKAYVGGQEINRKGGAELDFLAANSLTANAVLVEIKTPTTPLLGSPYRGKEGGKLYGASTDLSGAFAQIRNYRYRLNTEYYILRKRREGEFEPFAPKCLVIAGHAGDNLDTEEKVRSFEAIRGGLGDVELVTYDEMFEKVRALCRVLEGLQ